MAVRDSDRAAQTFTNLIFKKNKGRFHASGKGGTRMHTAAYTPHTHTVRYTSEVCGPHQWTSDIDRVWATLPDRVRCSRTPTQRESEERAPPERRDNRAHRLNAHASSVRSKARCSIRPPIWADEHRTPAAWCPWEQRTVAVALALPLLRVRTSATPQPRASSVGRSRVRGEKKRRGFHGSN